MFHVSYTVLVQIKGQRTASLFIFAVTAIFNLITHILVTYTVSIVTRYATIYTVT